MAATIVAIQFFSRRQNTNVGDDQYRLWLPREDAEKLAVFLPALDSCLKANETWSQRVHVSWLNGQAPDTMAFAAYKDQSGEMSFTASKKTLLFQFAEARHNKSQEDVPVSASCSIDNGSVQSINLDLTL
jgi:hypothetical protein